MNYTIGDFLVRLKNAYKAGKHEITYPYVRIIESIGQILEQEGFVKSLKVAEEKSETGKPVKKIVVELFYKGRRPMLHEVKLLSKPSVHYYANKTKVKRTLHDVGISIVSTSQGMMTSRNAVEKGIGGVLICRIF